MADSDLLLRDQSATPAAFAPESTDVGTNTAGTTVKRSMFGSKDGAQATIGAKADAAWDGSAASASLISIMKAGAARLLGIGGSTVPVSGTVALSGGNATAVKVDGSGVIQPVTMQSPPTGAALDSSLVAILNAIKAQIDIAPLFVTDGTHYYVRREQVNEGTQAITVVFENIDGTAATPASVSALTPIIASGSGGGSASTRYVEQTLFDVITAATGYAVGDVIARAVFYDTSTSSVVASAWLNLTQGTTLSGAPTAANLREQTQNTAITSSVLPAGAATEATLGLIRGLLSGTLAVTLPTGKAIPANSLSIKAFDNLATGTIASATANAVYTVALGNGEGVVGFSVSGLTASGATLTAEATNNSGNWVAINTILPGSGTLSQTLTADGNYRVNAAGHDNVRLRVSTVGTGTIAVGSVASSAQGLVALSAPATVVGVGTTSDAAYTDTTLAASGGLVALLKGIFGKLAGVLTFVKVPIAKTGSVTSATVGISASNAVLAAGAAPNFLSIDNESPTANIAVSFGGTPGINAAGSFTIYAGQTRTWSDVVPQEAVNIIASAAGTPVTIVSA